MNSGKSERIDTFLIFCVLLGHIPVPKMYTTIYCEVNRLIGSHFLVENTHGLSNVYILLITFSRSAVSPITTRISVGSNTVSAPGILLITFSCFVVPSLVSISMSR